MKHRAHTPGDGALPQQTRPLQEINAPRLWQGGGDERRGGAAAARELALLASLLQPAGSDGSDNFRLQLFDEEGVERCSPSTAQPQRLHTEPTQLLCDLHLGAGGARGGRAAVDAAAALLLQGVPMADLPDDAGLDEDLLALMDDAQTAAARPGR